MIDVKSGAYKSTDPALVVSGLGSSIPPKTDSDGTTTQLIVQSPTMKLVKGTSVIIDSKEPLHDKSEQKATQPEPAAAAATPPAGG